MNLKVSSLNDILNLPSGDGAGSNSSILKNETSELYFILKEIFSKGYDQPKETAIIIVFSILILLGVLGNSLVCFVFLKRPKMRTPRNIFIINLAVCDLTLCLFTQPFNLVRLLQMRWSLGESICKLVPACSATNFYVSTISITAIALDRFQVIVYPTRDSMKTGKALYISLLFIWFASICMALPIVFFYKLKPFILWEFYFHDDYSVVLKLDRSKIKNLMGFVWTKSEN